MKEKPSQWEFIATVLVLFGCTGWAFYEYRQEPDKIPFEPVITAATWLIALLGYTKLGKNRSAKKPANLGISAQNSPGITISNAKNIVSQSPISATNVHIGDVIQYGDRPIPRALTKAPFFPETFLGRKADLRRIHNKLFTPDGHFLLLVNGEGGIGKTTLASKYYHNYQHEYAHTAWLLAEKSIANALLLLADPLGLQFDERMGTEGRLDLLLAAMADLQKPCLLVLDNANELPDLEANYLALRRLSNFHLLLTTRISSFEKAETLRIEGLPEAEALALFEGYYRPLGDEERALFFQIREAVGGNTLVIELLAKNLALFNKFKTNYTLGNLLADLQEKGLLRLTRSQEVRTDYQSKAGQMRREKPEDIIAAMYDLGELPREEVALLSVFAVLPAESIGFEILERLLPGLENLETNLTTLAQKGWIEYNEAENAFKCSPVVQELTKLKSPNLTETCRPLIEALNKELNREVLHIDNYKHSILFTRYAEMVVNTLKEPDYDLGILCQNTGNFHIATGDLSNAIWAYQKMADIFRGSPENVAFKYGLAISYEKLGSIQSMLGNSGQALTFFEYGTKLFEELCEVYPQNISLKNSLAISYSKLGETHNTLGNLVQALTFFRSFSNLMKELYNGDFQNISFKNSLAISYSKLGETFSTLGDLEQALTFFEHYNLLEKELYDAYPQNIEFKNGLASSYSRLGEIQSMLGNFDQALTFFEKDIELIKELYETYSRNVSFKNGLAIAYAKLADIHAMLGNFEQSFIYFEQYNLIEKELYEASPQNVEFKKGLAISYERLGTTQSALGNFKQALAFLEIATNLFKELSEAHPQNVEFKNGLAISHGKIAFAQSTLGNLKEALIFFEDEITLFEKLYGAYPQNMEFKNGLAISYAKLGRFNRDHLTDKTKARLYFQQAEALWAELVQTSPQHVKFQRFLSMVREELAGLE